MQPTKRQKSLPKRTRAAPEHFYSSQRGCSLIMTSAFYNMAEEREERGLLFGVPRTFSTLDSSYSSSPVWHTEFPPKSCFNFLLLTTNPNNSNLQMLKTDIPQWSPPPWSLFVNVWSGPLWPLIAQLWYFINQGWKEEVALWCRVSVGR